MHITLIAGSARIPSISLRAALHLNHRLLHNPSVQPSLINLQDSQLPPVQHVWTDATKVPASYSHLYETLEQAEAIIVVSPEYNGGYSPAMKNFLDHFPKAVYQRKPWGIVTTSTGAMGGMRASQQLLLLGAGLFAIPCSRMLIVPHADKIFDATGALLDPSFQRQIDTFLEEYLWLAGQIAS